MGFSASHILSRALLLEARGKSWLYLIAVLFHSLFALLIFYHGLFYAETIDTKRPNASFSTAQANLVICEDSELGDMVHECAFKYLSPLFPDTFSWSSSSFYGAACPSDLLNHLKDPTSVTFRVSFLVA